MSINKSIFYQLCNKGIMVNLYKLLFLSSHFSFQPNKRVFHPPTFPSLQPNTHEGKLNIFHPLTIFHLSTFPLLQPNEPLENSGSHLWWVMEDLALRWKKLSLSEAEGKKCDLSKNKKSSAYVLAAKFFTRRDWLMSRQ